MSNPLWIVAAIVHSAAQVPEADLLSATDPFVVMRVHGQSTRTPTLQDCPTPRWDAPLHLLTRDSLLDDLRFELWDEDPFRDELLAVGALPPERLRACAAQAALPLVLLPHLRANPAGPPTLRLSYGRVRAYGSLLDRLRGVRDVLTDDSAQAVRSPALADGLHIVTTYHGDRVSLSALQAPRDVPHATFLEWAIADDDAPALPYTQRTDAARPWTDDPFQTLTVASATTAPLHPSLPLERLILRRLTAAPDASATALDLLHDAGWPQTLPIGAAPYSEAKRALFGALLDDLNHRAYLPLPDALYAHDFDAAQGWLLAADPTPGAYYYALRPPPGTEHSTARGGAGAAHLTQRAHHPRPHVTVGFRAAQSLRPADATASGLAFGRYTVLSVEELPLRDLLPLR